MNERERHYQKHYEESTTVPASPEEVFAYADDHRNFSLHMNKSSGMMGGGKMATDFDEGQGRQVGSHIRMAGKAFGLPVFVETVVTEHNPPEHKGWETTGPVMLCVIDRYKMGFDIQPQEPSGASIKISIDYDLPKSRRTKFLGVLFHRSYAKWCVRQMVNGVNDHFTEEQ